MIVAQQSAERWIGIPENGNFRCTALLIVFIGHVTQDSKNLIRNAEPTPAQKRQ